MKHSVKTLLVLMLAALSLAACKKSTDEDLLIGTWANTADSHEITIRGCDALPSHTIHMEFKANKVLIEDSRVDRIPNWQHYELKEEDGKRILQFEDHEPCVVEELTRDRMVLTVTELYIGIDWSFRYVMQRDEDAVPSDDK